jgi:hypothetical protein
MVAEMTKEGRDCVTITGLFVSNECSGPDESRMPGPRSLVGIGAAVEFDQVLQAPV